MYLGPDDVIDPDTAELVVTGFGQSVSRLDQKHPYVYPRADLIVAMSDGVNRVRFAAGSARERRCPRTRKCLQSCPRAPPW